jgi:hypothetical protein
MGRVRVRWDGMGNHGDKARPARWYPACTPKCYPIWTAQGARMQGSPCRTVIASPRSQTSCQSHYESRWAQWPSSQEKKCGVLKKKLETVLVSQASSEAGRMAERGKAAGALSSARAGRVPDRR